MQTIQVPETQYIYPPRTETPIPKDAAQVYINMGWLIQPKYNDTHITIKILPGRVIELWNRHGEQLRTYTLPHTIESQIHELANKLNLDQDKWHLLDGGLLDQKHKAIRDTIVIWDILVHNNHHQLGTTYSSRYNYLKETLNPTENWLYTHPTHEPVDFGWKIDENILMPKNIQSNKWEELWQTIAIVNAPFTTKDNVLPVLEGVVMKHGEGELTMGYKEKNNGDWMVKSRVRTKRHRY